MKNLQEDGALVDVTDLLVDGDIRRVGHIAGRIPSEKVEVLKHLRGPRGCGRITGMGAG